MFKFLLLLFGAVYLCQAETIRFKISANNLPKSDIIRSIDPYVKVYYKTANGGMEIPLGRTLPKFNNKNPKWATVFTFDYRPGAQQKLHLKVFDTDAGIDDFVGDGYLDMDDYKLMGENSIVTLRQGSLLVTKV